MKKIRKILLALAPLIFGSFLHAASINNNAPAFSLNNLKGEEVALSQFEGKVVFVNFWATWCPPCKIEFPELNQLAEDFQGKDFHLLAVNIDDDRRKVEKYLKKMKMESPAMEILLDPESEVVESYNAEAMPSTFVMDQKGIIRYIHVGFAPEDPATWREELNSLLEKSQ